MPPARARTGPRAAAHSPAPTVAAASARPAPAPRPPGRAARDADDERRLSGGRAAAATAALLASTPFPALAAYTPPPPPGPEIWIGAIVPVGVFIFGAVEFTKRIVIQRRCAVCSGTGLVTLGGDAAAPGRKVKCRACGGFFPWESWGRFLEAAATPGNGGVLRPPTLPRQTSVVYRVPSVEEAKEAADQLEREARARGEEGT